MNEHDMVSTENVPHTNLTPEQYVRVHMDLTRRLMHQLDVRDRATLHVAMAQAWATLAASQARQEVPTPETPSEAVTRAHSHADDPLPPNPKVEVFTLDGNRYVAGVIYRDCEGELQAITTTTRGGVPLMQPVERDGTVEAPGTYITLEAVVRDYGPLEYAHEFSTPIIPVEPKSTPPSGPPEELLIGKSYLCQGAYYQPHVRYRVGYGKYTGQQWMIIGEDTSGMPLMRQVTPEGKAVDPLFVRTLEELVTISDNTLRVWLVHKE